MEKLRLCHLNMGARGQTDRVNRPARQLADTTPPPARRFAKESRLEAEPLSLRAIRANGVAKLKLILEKQRKSRELAQSVQDERAK